MPDWTGRKVPKIRGSWWREGSLFVEFESTCVVRYPDVGKGVWLAFDYLEHDMRFFDEYIRGYFSGFMQTMTTGGQHYTECCVGY